MITAVLKMNCQMIPLGAKKEPITTAGIERTAIETIKHLALTPRGINQSY